MYKNTSATIYWVITRKNLALWLPGGMLKVKEPVPVVSVPSLVHKDSGWATLVELTSTKWWLAGPVPAMVIGLP